jgi:hypothetical protein
MTLPSENLIEQKRLERFHTFKDGIVRYKTGGLGARRGWASGIFRRCRARR